MKKSILLFIILGLFCIYSCSQKSNDSAIQKPLRLREINKNQKKEIIANSKLKLEITGMVCEMGCGGSIRKEMLQTNAVATCKFDYQKDRASNFVEIAYDNKKITPDKLVSILSTMNDNQFKIVN